MAESRLIGGYPVIGIRPTIDGMDMDPTTIKGVWGLNGTERPGAVYLASVLATHARKGVFHGAAWVCPKQDVSNKAKVRESNCFIFCGR